MRIQIEWSSGSMSGVLNETATARKLFERLPVSGSANLWGDEVYFSVPLDAEPEEDAKQVVDPGTVCYWVEGRAVALPFGPTPISEGDECRLAAPCNLLGTLDGDPKTLSSIQSGETVTLVQAD